MKRSIVAAVLAIGVTASVSHGAFGQTSSTEEASLRTTQQALDAEAVGRSGKSQAAALASQFKVEPQVVENLRATKQGWGEIGIRLALAQELAKIDPKTYPSMTEALARVGDLRAEGKGWGAIAKELGFKLGPVVSEANRVRHELRAEAKSAETGSVKPDKDLRKADDRHTQKAERAEHMTRPDRPERPQRPERVERPEKPERPGR
jgi:hypothetical protein